jgi:low temperature requirement protein LtrA
VGEDFALSHPEERGSVNHAMALIGGPILFLSGMIWMKTVSSRFVPWSHCAGILALLATFFLVPFAANFVTQVIATTVLFVVALWEFVALKRFRRAMA